MLNTRASVSLTQMGRPTAPLETDQPSGFKSQPKPEMTTGQLFAPAVENREPQIDAEIAGEGNRLEAQRFSRRIRENEGCTSAIDVDVFPGSPARQTTSQTRATV